MIIEIKYLSKSIENIVNESEIVKLQQKSLKTLTRN